MISSKVILKKSRFGKGLFAKENITKDELILIFEGIVYKGKASEMPDEFKDHAVQFDKDKWLYPEDSSKFINHSCNPNCGIKGLFKIVAMKDIMKREELTFDYDTTENGEWIMKCECGEKNCRKRIQGYRFLPEEVKEKYKDYISDWLK